ncbi:MAG: hypothetical protein UU34_C0001G0135 [Candidatus Curtissbacteria bacterium GW2011_GWA1_41_11]|uniref:Methyltransferase type 11 domain-containing protein n=1 Tax=Candidatus Curtissbacteria bacterium GW2011_GWA1_41_11 TaxID=1618409 RepID=A0A0G0UH42_9BACT|nr:MAG: hypothetical protein UU34_C0001G0135 [Candidatus Curtissbacteria bacterium GW2011_GWA1_41_11]
MSYKTSLRFFNRYLKIAPLSLALWRSAEAQELEKYKLKKPILDVGCGFGEFGGVFFSRQIEVGLDIDHKEILRASATGKYKKTVIADAKNLPFKDYTFNTVISISTLEHIPNNSQVFKEIYRVLKPGGCFYFTVPTEELFQGLLIVNFLNVIGLRSIALIYYRIFNKVFKHVFIPSEKIWLTITRSTGFNIEKVQGTFTKTLLRIFELALPFALPSQLGKIFLGRRLVYALDIKLFIFRPLVRLIKSDSTYKGNILVFARKPQKTRGN